MGDKYCTEGIGTAALKTINLRMTFYSIEVLQNCDTFDVPPARVPLSGLEQGRWDVGLMHFGNNNLPPAKIFLTFPKSAEELEKKGLSQFTQKGALNTQLITVDGSEYCVIDGNHRLSSLKLHPPAIGSRWVVWLCTVPEETYGWFKNNWGEKDSARKPFF